MEPRSIAALLGQEIDSGFAAALTSLESSRTLRVNRIVSRVGGVPQELPAGDVPDWDTISWQAEVVLYPDDPGLSTDGLLDGELAEGVSSLPVIALQGVGHVWSERFNRWGITTIGQLAQTELTELKRQANTNFAAALVFVGRARTVAAAQPFGLRTSGGENVLTVATSTPVGDAVIGHARRAYAITLVSCLDNAYVRRLYFS